MVVLVCCGLALVAMPARACFPVPPASWRLAARCVHEHEVAGHVGRADEWSINTGNGYYGGFQFDRGTWESVGGVGLASSASPTEQRFRAWKLWQRRGWQPWPRTSRACGLR